MSPQLRLIDARTSFERSTIAVNTAKGYAHDFLVFEQWCRRMGREFLPATSETVSFYLSDLIHSGRKISTAVRRTSGISYYHRAKGFKTPVTTEVWHLLNGAQRLLKQRPRHVRPLTVANIRAISGRLKAANTPQSLRDRAVIVLGFCTSLRRASLTELRVSDVEFAPKGLVVRVRFDKTDQEGKGRQVGIASGKHRDTNAASCLLDWLNVREPGEGPLFTHVRMSGLRKISGATVGRIIKLAVESIGLDPAMYAGHSMRSGLVTACINAGLSDLMIAAHTGHKRVETLRIYHRRTSDPFEGTPTALIDL